MAVTVTTYIVTRSFTFDVLLVAVIIGDCIGRDSLEPVKFTRHFANVYLLHNIIPNILDLHGLAVVHLSKVHLDQLQGLALCSLCPPY